MHSVHQAGYAINLANIKHVDTFPFNNYRCSLIHHIQQDMASAVVP